MIYLVTRARAGLVFVFAAACFIKIHQDMTDVFFTNTADETAAKVERVMAQRHSDSFAYLLLVCCLLLLFVVLGVTFYAYANERKVSFIRDKETGEVPALALDADGRWHVMLSHIWASGQDQMAVLKRQLLLMVPGISVFLDVDDLTDIGELEAYVEASATMLLFLSRGYFHSRNCMREVRHTLIAKKHFVLLHDADLAKGGLALHDSREECPVDLRTAVFSIDEKGRVPRGVVTWMRIFDFQQMSLKLIVEAMLRGMPNANPKAPIECFIPGEMHPDAIIFEESTTIYASDFNPGASRFVAELCERLGGSHSGVSVTWTSQLPADLEIEIAAGSTSMRSPTCGSVAGRATRKRRISSLPALRRATLRKAQASAPAGGWLTGGAKEDTGPNCVFLLYLNQETWINDEAPSFATEVRAARAVGMKVCMVHENDPERGGCEFARFFQTTPEDLLADGIFKVWLAHRWGRNDCVCVLLSARSLTFVITTCALLITGVLDAYPGSRYRLLSGPPPGCVDRALCQGPRRQDR